MNRILIFAAYVLTSAGLAHAAVRDGNATSRQKSTSAPVQRTTTREKNITSRTSVLPPRAVSVSRAATSQKSASATATRTPAAATTPSRATAARTDTPKISARNATPVVARAADTAATTTAMSETRTGAAYEQCKNAYFTCMDQFCTLKNDDYRRCSCSNRVYDLTKQRQVLQDAGEQLTVFTENLNVVGMTAAQAAAMKTASEGENALTSDSSASKALLQAIMNSIRGTDSSVGGKYSDLNSINISFDTSNAFGVTDAGQAVASYNGQNLYTAVYPNCRAAVRADCNDASLQRAVTAYLMAVEQDCNTLATAIEEKQKQMKSAVREGSAMLDLARVENRQKHNSSDIATCVADVETAILSEEVCGAGYHKCLDNGEFIDISTGAPIAGVANFYELEQLLTFPAGVDAADQKLTRVSGNRTFVQNFEKRVKKFAEPALDKCTEQADAVWAEYLDKAMLDIYYAQKSKVSQIRQGCFDFVSACYMNGDTSITAAMKELTGDASVIAQPGHIALNDALCTDYVNSCNNMFDEDIIADYIKKRTDTDTLTACRAVVKQCFDKYGGTRYENFYYPYSGLFGDPASAPDWFTLYEIADDGELEVTYNNTTLHGNYKSECAKQLTKIDACNDQKMIELAFGGFDKMHITTDLDTTYGIVYIPSNNLNADTIYGYNTMQPANNNATYNYSIHHRNLRPTGVATEIYNQIIDLLTTQCNNVQGRFVEYQFIRTDAYTKDNFCISNFKNSLYDQLADDKHFHISNGEDMCPRDYGLNVATQSWGACLCWENGGRRSKWGKSAKCMAVLPTYGNTQDKNCTAVTNLATKVEISHALQQNDPQYNQLIHFNDPNINVDLPTPIENWCTIPEKFRDTNNTICLETDLQYKCLALPNNMPIGKN